MAKRPGLRVHISGPARQDIAAIIKRSIREFGIAASLRFEGLIQQALCDIGTDPDRPGSKERPELIIDGARTWHLELSRTRVSGIGVKEPRHFVLYRCREDGVVEVARILDHSRDLQRHLPDDYRRHN